MDPLLIGGILLAILILALVLAYLLFYNEQSFEDAVASQKASSDILIQSKSSGGKAGLKNRKKPKKERTKSEGESGVNEKVTKQESGEAQLEASDDSEPKSLEDEAATLFEAIPEKPIVAESLEEEKPAQKPKKKTKEKRRSERNRGVEITPPKEQEPAQVREEILVQESFVKTDAEPTLESLPPMVDAEPFLTKEEPIIQAGTASKKAKKSKSAKDKHSSAGIFIVLV